MDKSDLIFTIFLVIVAVFISARLGYLARKMDNDKDYQDWNSDKHK